MPSRRLVVRLAVLLAVAASLPVASWAETKAQSFEIGGALLFVRPDPDSDLSSRFAPRMILGYNFTKRHGAELLYDSFNMTPDNGPSFPIDVNVLRVGYVFNAYPKEKIVSFFRFGTGVWSLNPVDAPSGAPSNLVENDSNFMLYSGGGFRYFLRDNLALRFSATIDFVQSTPGIANNEIEATGEFGVTFVLGGKEPSPSE